MLEGSALFIADWPRAASPHPGWGEDQGGPSSLQMVQLGLGPLGCWAAILGHRAGDSGQCADFPDMFVLFTASSVSCHVVIPSGQSRNVAVSVAT